MSGGGKSQARGKMGQQVVTQTGRDALNQSSTNLESLEQESEELRRQLEELRRRKRDLGQESEALAKQINDLNAQLKRLTFDVNVSNGTNNLSS
jgi:chromosome segregation ATPase